MVKQKCRARRNVNVTHWNRQLERRLELVNPIIFRSHVNTNLVPFPCPRRRPGGNTYSLTMSCTGLPIGRVPRSQRMQNATTSSLRMRQLLSTLINQCLTVFSYSFSITKWIQLNGGDEALKTFFRRVYDVLEPGGTFILEPQAWDTYAKAKRMHEVRLCG